MGPIMKFIEHVRLLEKPSNFNNKLFEDFYSTLKNNKFFQNKTHAFDEYEKIDILNDAIMLFMKNPLIFKGTNDKMFHSYFIYYIMKAREKHAKIRKKNEKINYIDGTVLDSKLNKPDEMDETTTKTEKDDVSSSFHDCVEKLPDHLREICKLLLKNVKKGDIAKSINTNSTGLTRRLQYLYANLRECFEKKGYNRKLLFN